jgi:hypothetical protein
MTRRHRGSPDGDAGKGPSRSIVFHRKGWSDRSRAPLFFGVTSARAVGQPGDRQLVVELNRLPAALSSSSNAVCMQSA